MCPAGTITQTERGAVSFAARSSSEEAPVAPSPSSSEIASGLTSKATISWPSRIRRLAMLAPMRPSPTIPSCIHNLLGLLAGQMGGFDARRPILGADAEVAVIGQLSGNHNPGAARR